MRITISDTPAPTDFAWAGSANLAGGSLAGGETEDYPVTINTPPVPCPEYMDFGDAHTPTGATSTSDPHHETDLEVDPRKANPHESDKRD
jgi:hypothetical protein